MTHREKDTRMSAYLPAAQIVGRLSGEKKVACIAALVLAEQGQARLSSGDWNGALDLCRRAQDGLASIPEARPLLGVTKADLAAALGNLGRHSEAGQVAEQALPLIQGIHELRETEGALHMTIGIGHYREGNAQIGARHFEIARQVFRSVPGGAQMLQILESNEAQLRALD
jgi:hypothetical protein